MAQVPLHGKESPPAEQGTQTPGPPGGPTRDPALAEERGP